MEQYIQYWIDFMKDTIVEGMMTITFVGIIFYMLYRLFSRRR